jgi:hypothetical protein
VRLGQRKVKIERGRTLFRIDDWRKDGGLIDPVFRCIYCDDETTGKEREHVVPKAIGGKIVFKGATCHKCERFFSTQLFERMFSKGLVQGIRDKLSIRGYSRGGAKQRAQEELQIYRNGVVYSEKLLIDEIPYAILVPVFAPPLLARRVEKLSNISAFKQVYFSDKIESDRLLAKLKCDAYRFKAGHASEILVAKFVAKIAHCIAAISVGQAFNSTILRFIKNEPSLPANNFIGCELKDYNRPQGECAIELREEYIDSARLLSCYINIFCHLGMPTYKVIVHCDDFELRETGGSTDFRWPEKDLTGSWATKNRNQAGYFINMGTSDAEIISVPWYGRPGMDDILTNIECPESWKELR